MKTNREIADFMLDKIRSFGYKPYDIEYGNGYFLFDMGEDSVVHFRVKGVNKHWKFGMWIDAEAIKYAEEDKNKSFDNQHNIVQIFAQYDTCINKFKPSRSNLCCSYGAGSWNDDVALPNAFYELENMLGFMKRHFFLAYNGVCTTYYPAYSFVKEFFANEGYHYRKKLKIAINYAIWVPYTRIKCFFAKRDKCISSLVLEDFEKENPGWSTSYRFSVRPTFTAEATEDEELTWLNKWFRKRQYGHWDKYHCMIEIEPTKEGSDIRYLIDTD